MLYKEHKEKIFYVIIAPLLTGMGLHMFSQWYGDKPKEIAPATNQQQVTVNNFYGVSIPSTTKENIADKEVQHYIKY
ncbi:hypothetical protein QUF84_00135 [Fictibacillus enclensis]|uniref:hypothetical protein n=1 Tax=Fictibacillus enclensis TaxID=1017270 RepID=UPI0025A04B63|nr:hypothetical protein [Fictibacillus enclensis]MDM5335704.1 hypothetical protein [Fictibacillus enclensis]